MDAVSYAHSAKQAQRIKKFINEPDSTSGIVTVPKVIASGETITIPAGRVAVLPDLQMDGVLNVEGEVFIPSGSKMSQVIPRVTSTDNAIVRFDGVTGAVQNSGVIIDDNGNLNITGIGKRITGDFSNVAAVNRLAFQSSVANGLTAIEFMPNGTSNYSSIEVLNSSDAVNHAGVYIAANRTTSTIINSFSRGTGTALPLAINVAGSERMIIDTNGNVLLTSATGGLGYGTGAGGTVTQLTSKSTAVTLNKPSGQIITSNSSLGANAETGFVFYNSLITSKDILEVIVGGLAASGVYRVNTAFCIDGSAFIFIKNYDSVSRSEMVTINFILHKGATA